MSHEIQIVDMMQRDKYTQDEKCIAGFMRDVAAYLGIIYFSLMEMFTVYSSINSLESKQSCDMQQSPPPPCSDSLHYSPLLHYHLSQQYVHLLSLLSTHCRISEKMPFTTQHTYHSSHLPLVCQHFTHIYCYRLASLEIIAWPHSLLTNITSFEYSLVASPRVSSSRPFNKIDHTQPI